MTDCPEPFLLFQQWYQQAEKKEVNDPNAMALATVGTDLKPSVRMVLLKSFDQEGFVFYTNNQSKKGRQILENQHVALCLHWKSLRRQVRIEGSVNPVSAEEADEYFHSRARTSQIGAWASQQSHKLQGRFELEKRVAEYTAKFLIGEIPRPDYWSGWRVNPEIIEFWEDGAFRLHDRTVYEKTETGWQIYKLYP